MGECGCCESLIDAAYQVGEYVLAVEKYPGCRECERPIAVYAYLLRPEEIAGLGIEVEIGPFPVNRFGMKVARFPLIGEKELRAASTVIDGESSFDLSEDASRSDLLAEHGLRLLQEALRQNEKSNQTGGRPSDGDGEGKG